MKYIEVILETPEEEIDRRCDELTAIGCSGFIIENENDFKGFLEENHQYWDYVDTELEESYSGVSRIKCYLEDNAEGQKMLESIKALGAELTTNTVDDSAWENNWQDYYKPLPIGEKLLVVPDWDDSDSGERIPLRLEPGLMFGTGSHATTRMCLEALENSADTGKTALDLGCGSGILGIGALILGCKKCVGCDIDPKAPNIAASNAALNGIEGDKFKVYAGDITGDAGLRKRLGAGYDIVLANIVSDVIIALSPFVRGFMAQEGVFITSGIIDGREDDVRIALENAGFEITEHLHEEEWHCFVCR